MPNVNAKLLLHLVKKNLSGFEKRSMPYVARITLEAVIVGVVFLLLSGTVHAIDMLIRKQGAMTHKALALHVFLAGIVGHVLFETFGVNRWYAASYK